MTKIITLKKLTRADKLEGALRKLMPSAKEIRVRETNGFDITMEDGFVFQVLQENYGVSFYVEEKPPAFLLNYTIADEDHRKIFASKDARDEFKDKLPGGVEFQESDID